MSDRVRRLEPRSTRSRRIVSISAAIVSTLLALGPPPALGQESSVDTEAPAPDLQGLPERLHGAETEAFEQIRASYRQRRDELRRTHPGAAEFERKLDEVKLTVEFVDASFYEILDYIRNTGPC